MSEYCMNCGAKLSEDDRTCWNCGLVPKDTIYPRIPSSHTDDPLSTGQTRSMSPPADSHASRGALHPAPAKAEISGWETCEITFETNSRSRNRFLARAVGPNGAYEAGRSQALTGGAFFEVLDDLAGVQKQGPSPEVERNVQVLHTLVAQLVDEGWEPTEEHGDHWWSVKFKRRLR